MDFKKYFTFIFGGGVGFIINISVTIFFTEIVGFWHMFSYAIGLTGNVTWNFVFHSFITFQTHDLVWKRFSNFMIVTTIIVLSNYALVFITTTIFNFNYIVSITVITFILSFANFMQ